MCKLAILSGITQSTRDNAWLFIHKITVHMSAMDRDGFGYAAMASNGETFGERWLRNGEAWNNRDLVSALDQKIMDDYDEMIFKDVKYNKFGSLQYDAMTSITLHSRMATSGKAFMNTHPFTCKNDETTLVHNGVLKIHNSKELIYSSCDSEQILTKYLKYKVNLFPANIQKVANELDGYYACGMFTVDKSGKKVLDIFKDDRANLYAAFVKELNTVVFATSIEHIRMTCQELNFEILSEFYVRPETLLRLNAITGKTISSHNFKAEYKHKGKYSKPSYLDSETTSYPSTHSRSAVVEHIKNKYPDALTKTVDDDMPEYMHSEAYWSKIGKE